MAAKYRKIDPRIWEDEVFDDLDCHEALAALWVLTGRSTNRCGIVVASLGEASDKLRVENKGKAFDRLSEVCPKFGWPIQKVTQNTVVIVLPKWFKYNGPTNAKHFDGMMSDLADVPRCDLVKQHFPAMRAALEEQFREAFDRLSIDYLETEFDSGIGSRYQKQKQEQKQEQKKKTPSPSFNPLNADIPATLQVEDFLEVWPLWCKHRSEIRKKLTETAVAQQLKELESWGSSRAVAAIKHTIARGWTGIREPENGHVEQRQRPREEELHGL